MRRLGGSARISNKMPSFFPRVTACSGRKLSFFDYVKFFGLTSAPLLWVGGMSLFLEKKDIPVSHQLGCYPALPKRVLSEQEIETLERYLRSTSLDVPDMISISEIMTWARPSSSSTGQSQETPTFYILTACDSLEVPAFSSMANSVRQVASQFNSGESPGRFETHPKDFQYDRTQGPAEQQTAYIAALSRWIHKDQCDGLSRLKEYDEFETYFDYQYGYLTPRLGHEVDGLRFLEKHIHEVMLNVQRVGVDGTQHHVIQVLNSALALGPYDLARESRTEKGNNAISQMTELLLTAQYQAVAAVAVREAHLHPNVRIPVVFTPVGGGVFCNDAVAIKKAIDKGCDVILRSGVGNLDVCLSAYQPTEAEIYASDHFKNATMIDQNQLSQLSSLSEFRAPTFTC